jgi:hypothetical protein
VAVAQRLKRIANFHFQLHKNPEAPWTPVCLEARKLREAHRHVKACAGNYGLGKYANLCRLAAKSGVLP